MDNNTDGPRLAQAVLEGATFAHASGMSVLREAGTQIAQLAVIGGGARSDYWGRITAAVLEKMPLVY